MNKPDSTNPQSFKDWIPKHLRDLIWEHKSTMTLVFDFGYRTAWHGYECPIKTGDERPEQVGTNGYDKSINACRLVSLDIDMGDHHAAGTVTQEQMDRAIQIAKTLPGMTVAHSKSGIGVHIHAIFEVPYPCEKEDITDLARTIFKPVIEVLPDGAYTAGGNMWFFNHKHYTAKTSNSFALIHDRDGYTPHPEKLIRRKKNIGSIKATYANTELSPKHIEILNELNMLCVVVIEGNRVTTHTAGIKQLHATGNYKGLYDSNSPGTDLSSPNCFMFPIGDGFVIYTFGIDSEREWVLSASGAHRTATFNYLPEDELKSLLYAGDLMNKSLKMREKLDSEWRDEMKKLGVSIDPNIRGNIRPVFKDGGIEFSDGKTTQFVELDQKQVCFLDDYLRNMNGKWFLRNQNDKDLEAWIPNVDNMCVKLEAKRRGLIPCLADARSKPWKYFEVPFQGMYPADGSRAFRPEADEDWIPVSEEGNWTTWKKLFDHTGQYLTPYVRRTDWCAANNVMTGGDFILHWVVSMIRNPEQSLPFLVLYSLTTGTGKSTFAEALYLYLIGDHLSAIAKGRLDKKFNADVAPAVLVHFEEVDLAGQGDVIKQLVTAGKNAIEKKNVDPTKVISRLHFVATLNKLEYIPLTDDDTRFIIIEAQPIEEDEDFRVKLEAEAPAMRYAIENFKLPKKGFKRLFLPVLETEAKSELIQRIDKESKPWIAELIELLDAGEIAPAITFAKLSKLLKSTPGPPHLGRLIKLNAVANALYQAGWKAKVIEGRTKRITFSKIKSRPQGRLR